MFEKINVEILKLIEEYNNNHDDQPNCIIISSEYYHIILKYISQLTDDCIKFTKLYNLGIIVIDSKNFIKVCRREFI